MDKTMLLLRHGDVDAQRPFFKGKGCTIGLSEHGRMQTRRNMEELLRLVDGRSAQLYSSPAPRCVAAKDFASSLPFKEMDDLDDIPIGQLSGRTEEEANEMWPGLIPELAKDATQVLQLPGVEEKIEAFRERSIRGFQALLKELLEGEMDVAAAMTHGRVKEEVIAHVNGEKAVKYFSQQTAAVSIIQVRDGRPVVIADNLALYNGDARSNALWDSFLRSQGRRA
jgi:broad specificity phosphatase PhoE